MIDTRPVLGWRDATLPSDPPVLLATLRAPRRNGTVVQVYSDGSLAYQWPPNPKWVRSRLSVYSGAQRGRIGTGENLTPEQFIERHIEMGYTRMEAERPGLLAGAPLREEERSCRRS